MSVVLWILLALLLWTVLGLGVALVVGRMARQRDHQIPTDAPGCPAPAVPAPRDGSEQSARSPAGGAPPG